MSEHSEATVDETEAEVADNRELSPEELDNVSGGSGSGKRNAYNASQQPWQANI